MAFNADSDSSLYQYSYSHGHYASGISTRQGEIYEEIEEIALSEDVIQPLDFISTIAVTQSLSVDLLPLTWEPNAAGLGLGATANVQQLPLDAERSFAFKTLKDANVIERKRKGDQQQSIKSAYRVLINELLILANPKVREHSNTVELIGISFQIMDSDRVWPAITMKRTTYGDLESFAVSDEGKGTGIKCRLEICQDIADAVCHLHCHGESV